jgi:hypothetical protein
MGITLSLPQEMVKHNSKTGMLRGMQLLSGGIFIRFSLNNEDKQYLRRPGYGAVYTHTWR